jgi:hypothetical protein
MRGATVMLAPANEVDCVIRNISRTGAMIALEGTRDLPSFFMLDMSGNIVVQRSCELVWQDGRVAGVKFSALRGFQSIQFNLD